jgi:hypothetical protein
MAPASIATCPALSRLIPTGRPSIADRSIVGRAISTLCDLCHVAAIKVDLE